MIIRREEPLDYDEVYELVRLSFATTSDDDGTVPDYLNEVRKKVTFIPELSLVVECDRKLVGQIVLYETTISTAGEEITELLLSPICVHPEYFNRGIARMMINKACGLAKEMGYGAVFLCGDPGFYRKTGFSPTYEYGIFHIKDESRSAEWSMVRELRGGALKGVTGTVNTQ